MEETILALTVCAIIFGAIFTSCNSSSEKAEDAQKNITEANESFF